mmetsp:Transcript_81753/g.264908  ORF Transcript_81753/g.264908 Transcript_81753/m.264908 type:complete len:259 (+) Transcript_81753:29-805(+)
MSEQGWHGPLGMRRSKSAAGALHLPSLQRPAPAGRQLPPSAARRESVGPDLAVGKPLLQVEASRQDMIVRNDDEAPLRAVAQAVREPLEASLEEFPVRGIRALLEVPALGQGFVLLVQVAALELRQHGGAQMRGPCVTRNAILLLDVRLNQPGQLWLHVAEAKQCCLHCAPQGADDEELCTPSPCTGHRGGEVRAGPQGEGLLLALGRQLRIRDGPVQLQVVPCLPVPHKVNHLLFWLRRLQFPPTARSAAQFQPGQQ